jgi:hypothetical protein
MTAIVIPRLQFHPAFVPLACDVRRANLSLRHQRIDLTVKQVTGTFARIDGAALQRWELIFGHSTPPN